MKRFYLSALCVVLSLSSTASEVAPEELSERDYTIEVEEISSEGLERLYFSREFSAVNGVLRQEKKERGQARRSFVNTLSTVNKAIDTVDKFLMLGEKVWKIIKAGKPVMNIKGNNPVDILPVEAKSNPNPMFLHSWSFPEFKAFRARIKNFLGETVAESKYGIVYSHGGKRGEHPGSYLKGVTFVPVFAESKWGFTANVTGRVLSVFNMGSEKDPVAALTIEVSHDVEGVFLKKSRKSIYTVAGNGEFRAIFGDSVVEEGGARERVSLR